MVSPVNTRIVIRQVLDWHTAVTFELSSRVVAELAVRVDLQVGRPRALTDDVIAASTGGNSGRRLRQRIHCIEPSTVATDANVREQSLVVHMGRLVRGQSTVSVGTVRSLLLQQTNSKWVDHRAFCHAICSSIDSLPR